MSDTNNQESHIVNARRLLCPMPVIRTQDAIEKMKVGEKLEVVCTDPGTLHDIPSWCRINGHTIENIDEKNFEGMKEITFTILVEE